VVTMQRKSQPFWAVSPAAQQIHPKSGKLLDTVIIKSGPGTKKVGDKPLPLHFIFTCLPKFQHRDILCG